MKKLKFSNWPFKEDEVVTLHWIASPKVGRDGSKNCRVYFRREDGVLQPTTVPWGTLPALWIGQKFTNRSPIEEHPCGQKITISTHKIYKLNYGESRNIIPRTLYSLKEPSIFQEWCCSFQHNWYTYYIPCVELARVFLAQNTVLANRLISSGGLEDLIDISSW